MSEDESIVDRARVDEGVLALRPDYRALLITVSGLVGGPSDDLSEAALTRAETAARARLAGAAPETLPEVASWRAAFLDFGVKPRQARSSVEALLRRVDAGLPRINRLTDLYNAISIEHAIPIGGEDLTGYIGPPVLVRADGNEPFDTMANGEPIVESPEPGEVVWRDDVGVTCRRWNWRQCVRTRLTEDTTEALFILDALDPISTEALLKIGEQLTALLRETSPQAQLTSRLIGD